MTEQEFDPELVEWVRRMSDEDIVRTFDELIEAWEAQRDVHRQLEQFHLKYIYPEPPAPHIGSVEALVEYNRQKWRYEERLEAIEARSAEYDEALATRETLVKALLPAGHVLHHVYRGSHQELKDNEYSITHTHPPTQYPPLESAPPGAIIIEQTGSAPGARP